jgi:FAD binding domain
MSDLIYRSPRDALVNPGQIESHVADMTITVAADVPLETVQNHLAKFDQWIPIDGDARLPIGQLIETNSTGPLRLGYGAWRDLLLGCQFKTGDGRLITAGGRTMKNVAGYDLVKLMVGQGKMLGSLLTITCRTYARPAAALVAEFEPSDKWLGQIISTPLRPRWAILRSNVLICGWMDDERAVSLFERLTSEYRPRRILRRSLVEDIDHRASLWKMTGNHFRAAVGPAKILCFAERAGILNWVADAAFGIVIGPYVDGEDAAIQNAAESCGGSAAIFAGEEPPRWKMTPAEQMILERLRKAFGPDG